jgi:6-pyruvoyl-tetrahydropterin synthase
MSTIDKYSNLIMIRNHAYSILSGAQYFASFSSADKKLISKLISSIDHQFLIDLQALTDEVEAKAEVKSEAKSEVKSETKAKVKVEVAADIKLEDTKVEEVKAEESKEEQSKTESKKDKKPGFKRV